MASQADLLKLQDWLHNNEAEVTKAMADHSWLRIGPSPMCKLYLSGKFAMHTVQKTANNEVDIIFSYLPTGKRKNPWVVPTLTIKDTHLVSDTYTVQSGDIMDAIKELIADRKKQGSLYCTQNVKVCKGD